MSYLDAVPIICGVAYVPAPSLDAVRAGRAVIRKGMQGSPVEYVQALAGAIADGKFGPETERAVIVFQIGQRIGSTGIVDQATLAALDRRAGRPETPASPSPQTPPPQATAPHTPVSMVPVADLPPATTALQAARGMPSWKLLVAGAAVTAFGAGIYLLTSPSSERKDTRYLGNGDES